MALRRQLSLVLSLSHYLSSSECGFSQFWDVPIVGSGSQLSRKFRWEQYPGISFH